VWAVEGEDGRESEQQPEDVRMDEETISRLRKAEEEADQLRKEVASLRANQEKEAVLSKAGRRFWTGAPYDAKDLKRETMLESDTASGNWLSETDVDFLIGKGENGGGVLSPEDQAIVNRRLAVGGALTALCVGLAFIPTETFNFIKPSGTATDYLVPVLRSQDILAECRPLVEEAEWDQVRLVIDRIINAPNKLKSNLDAALAFVTPAEDRSKGRQLIADILEFIQEMDYNKYYEDRLNRQRYRGGAEEAKFVEFSLNSLTAAEGRLQIFLSLFLSNDIDRARQRITAVYQ